MILNLILICLQLPSWDGYDDHERNHYEYRRGLFPEIKLTTSQRLGILIRNERQRILFESGED